MVEQVAIAIFGQKYKQLPLVSVSTSLVEHVASL